MLYNVATMTTLLPNRFLESIKYVTSNKKNDNRNGARLLLDKLTIQLSNPEKNIHQFVYDGVIIKRKNNYFVCFDCLECKRENLLAMNNVTSKINRGITKCSSCLVGLSMRDKIISDKAAFEVTAADFKKTYERKLMQPKHFEKLRHAIMSFQYGKFQMGIDIEYIPYFRPTESLKNFEPCFYDVKRDVVEKAVHLQIKCDHCGYMFHAKHLQPYRNANRLLCQCCTVKLGPTKPKYEANIMGVNTMFKTSIQHKLIKHCNKHDIVCSNGPSLDFYVDGRKKHTNIDYIIGGNLIDIVGNNEFQTTTCDRALAIDEYAAKHDLKYIVIHPKNYVSITRNLLQNRLQS